MKYLRVEVPPQPGCPGPSSSGLRVRPGGRVRRRVGQPVLASGGELGGEGGKKAHIGGVSMSGLRGRVLPTAGSSQPLGWTVPQARPSDL